jgi:hypothetical protein
MANIKVKLSRLTTKKVPAMSLVLVALIGMVAGVLAATLTLNNNTYTGEVGTYHQNTAGFAIADSGINVAANTIANNGTTTVTFTSSAQQLYINGVTAGQWVETLVFTPPVTATTHTTTIKILSGGTGALGSTTIYNASLGANSWTTGVGNTGAVTVYIGMGSSLSVPFTVYVNIT